VFLEVKLGLTKIAGVRALVMQAAHVLAAGRASTGGDAADVG